VFGATLTIQIAQVSASIMAVAEAMAAIVANPLSAKGASSILGGKLSAIGLAGDVASGAVDSQRYTPQYKSLPDLFGNSDEYFKRLKAAESPTSMDVPAASGDWMTRQAAAAEKMVAVTERVEKNTRETADVMSLRRQAIGPGAAGVIGPTATELHGGGAAGRTRGPGYIDVAATSAVVSDQLTQGLRKLIQQEVARLSGSGFRPSRV